MRICRRVQIYWVRDNYPPAKQTVIIFTLDAPNNILSVDRRFIGFFGNVQDISADKRLAVPINDNPLIFREWAKLISGTGYCSFPDFVKS